MMHFKRPRGLNCTTVPNFVEIAKTAADIWLFFDFQDAAAAILNLQNFKFLTVKRFEVHHGAKLHQNRLNRGRDMAIFQFFKMAVAAILDFLKFEIFNGRDAQEG